MRKHYYLLLVSLFFSLSLSAQNTIGTILNTAESFNGYTLITPNSATIPNKTYLINNCGEVVNQWTSNFKGQGADRLQADGTLYRACVDDQSTLMYPGNTGRIEHYDWDGTLIWGYTHSDTDFSFHHDYYPLPNGNVLMLIAERMTNAEAIQAGRDPSTLSQFDLYTEKIIEVMPVGIDDATIVWEWNLWDHLIQDFDASKDNFGVIADNQQLLDINFIGTSNNNADWVHFNAIDYNEELDQILISGRALSEIYLIDHSTTTAEASGSTGGNSGNGGDFLYRWGNPQVYDNGDASTKQFFGQHSPHWIEAGLPNAGKIMAFNNGLTRNFTTIDILTPPTPDANGNYPYTAGTAFEPSNAVIRYVAPGNPEDFFAGFLSSAYELPNGNVLIDNGPIGQLFEVNTSNETVWEYVSPITLDGTILSQGDAPGGINSRFFRARRYGEDFSGLLGQDLTPGDPIELNSDPEGCNLLSVADLSTVDTLVIYPTVADDQIQLQTSLDIFETTIYTIEGKQVFSDTNDKTVNVSHLSSGLYILHLQSEGKILVEKFVKK